MKFQSFYLKKENFLKNYGKGLLCNNLDKPLHVPDIDMKIQFCKFDEPATKIDFKATTNQKTLKKYFQKLSLKQEEICIILKLHCDDSKNTKEILQKQVQEALTLIEQLIEGVESFQSIYDQIEFEYLNDEESISIVIIAKHKPFKLLIEFTDFKGLKILKILSYLTFIKPL